MPAAVAARHGRRRRKITASSLQPHMLGDRRPPLCCRACAPEAELWRWSLDKAWRWGRRRDGAGVGMVRRTGERERGRAPRGEKQRERETQADSLLSVEPDMGLDPANDEIIT